MKKKQKIKQLKRQLSRLEYHLALYIDMTGIEPVRYCRKCKAIAKKGKAFGNAYSRPNQIGNRKIFPGAGNPIDCWKCINCGHSWTEDEVSSMQDPDSTELTLEEIKKFGFKEEKDKYIFDLLKGIKICYSDSTNEFWLEVKFYRRGYRTFIFPQTVGDLQFLISILTER